MEQQGLGHQRRLADTLDAASRRGFIGRSAELATFEALLKRPEPVSVLWLSCLGGVGKTALVQAGAGPAKQTGWRTARIDGRAVAQSPQAFADAVTSAGATDRPHAAGDDAGARRLAIFLYRFE